jgi:hypothetical protein
MLDNAVGMWENIGNAADADNAAAPLTTPLLKGAGGMAISHSTKFDLSTSVGRYQARKAGFDVPKLPCRKPRPFMDRVKKQDGGCWEWQGKTWGTMGYGVYSNNGKHVAHRWSYEAAFGPIPVGKLVMHTCDNPLCVRPEHLTLGTHKDNMQDARVKGRMKKAYRSNAILTEEDVREIKREPNTYVGTLADRYGVGKEAIHSIRRGRTWRSVQI